MFKKDNKLDWKVEERTKQRLIYLEIQGVGGMDEFKGDDIEPGTRILKYYF